MFLIKRTLYIIVMYVDVTSNRPEVFYALYNVNVYDPIHLC